MFAIQEGTRDVMVWAKGHDGRKICVHVCDDRLGARLWIETVTARLAGRA